MPVRKLEIAAPEWLPQTPLQGEIFTATVHVCTAMFGGGYKAREIDDVCMIRAAEIRGQLRFWWRATTRAPFASSAELFAAEADLWGSDKAPGKVALKVTLRNGGNAVPFKEITRDYKALAYALFPFQGDTQNPPTPPADGREGVSFQLSLSGPEVEHPDVQRALRTWLLLGGIGARTRRGCGSLTTENVYFNSAYLAGMVGGVQGTAISCLSGASYALGAQYENAYDAWAEAVRVYRDFRQGVNVGRNQSSSGDNRPGRSRWPEADAIRRATGTNSQQHRPEHKVEYGFPRADLGLPIIFHFKDKGDPNDARLEGSADRLSRFASPVITKAVAVGLRNFRPLLLLLNTPSVWSEGDLRLTTTKAVQDKTETGATHSKLKTTVAPVPREHIELTPAERAQVRPMKGKPAREALLDYVKGLGWSGGTLP